MIADLLRCVDAEKGVFRWSPNDSECGIDILSLGYFIKSYAMERGLTQARVCFHESDKAQLQKMLIFHDQRHLVSKHVHCSRDEFITLVTGVMRINFFDEQGIKVSSITLDEEKGIQTCLIRKGSIHEVLIEKNSLFIEDTVGPFRKDSTAYLH